MPSVSDRLIQLGELTPNITLTLPLDLTVDQPTSLQIVGLAGVTVLPAAIEAGTHTVTLTIEGGGLVKGELILGQLRLTGTDNTTRDLWIDGTVSGADLPTDARIVTLHARKTQLLPRDDGLYITDKLLAALNNRRIPDSNVRYAVLSVDALTKALTIYLPVDPEKPCTLNDQPIPALHRLLLNENDRVKIADTLFTVAPLADLPFRLDKAAIQLPVFDGLFPDPVNLEITTQAAGFRGELLIIPDWITAKPGGLLRLIGNKKHSWEIGFNEESLALPNGVYHERGGIILVGNDNLASLDVTGTIRRPSLLFAADPLDMGSTETGWPNTESFNLTITNYGRSSWRGTLKPNVGWLEVITPMPVTGEGWESVNCELRLVPEMPGLPPGIYSDEKALVLTAIADDEAGATDTLYVSVAVTFTPPRPHLELLTSSVHFPDVDRFTTALPAATIQIVNNGGDDFNGSAASATGLIQLQPDTFTIPPGDTLELNAVLTSIPDQSLNESLSIDTLTISEDTTGLPPETAPHPYLTVDVTLTLIELPPSLGVRAVEFPPFFQGGTPSQANLLLYNLGPSTWRGSVTTDLVWLAVPDEELTCEANHRLEIPITIRPSESNGESNAGSSRLPLGMNIYKDALKISGGRESTTATVQIDVRPYEAVLTIETVLLNFGAFNPTDPELPTERVRLVNATAEAWQGVIEIVPIWLSAENDARSFRLEVPNNSAVEFDVMLTDAARDLTPGVWSDPGAVTITTDLPSDLSGTDSTTVPLLIPASFVKLNTEAWITVDPDSFPAQGVVADLITITNTGAKRGDLQIFAADWLQVTPDRLTLDSGQSAQVRYTLIGEPIPDPRAIVLICAGRETIVAALPESEPMEAVTDDESSPED